MSGVGHLDVQPIGLSHVFRVMNPGYLGEVVKRVLAAERHLSKSTAQALRLHVRGVPVKGYRPGNGPLRLHQSFVAKRSLVNDQLAEAVLEGWVESNDEMQKLVFSHLRGAALLEKEFDIAKLSIVTTHWDDRWDCALEQLIEQNPSLSDDDLTLMTYLVGGQMPPHGDAQSEGADLVAVDVPQLFEGVLGALAELPLESPEWGYLPAHFVEAVSSLRTALAQRASQAEAAAELVGIATALVDAYSEALAFLEIDALERFTRPTGSWATPLAARDLLEKLGALLAEYDGVRNLAHTRTEEEIRRAHRIDLEAQIDDVLSSIDALELLHPQEDPSPAEVVTTAPSILFGEELVELLTEVEQLKREKLELQTERNLLAAERNSLSSERDALTDAIGRLEEDLDESRDNAEMWRQLYHLAQMPPEDDSTAVELPTAQNVAHAKQLAEERFSSQLEFRLISKSDLDIPFDKPQQVYDALEWLATIYYRGKTGEGGAQSLEFSIRETCGWRYTRLQSETTMGQFAEYYEIAVGGRKCKLEEHIGTGNGYDRGTIRIAFLWDAERRKVVIGYIGRHQRTAAT